MAITKASAQTAVNSGATAAAAATINQILIAPASATVANGGTSGGVTISNVSITDSTFANVLSGDTAVSTAGGFVKITGTGFKTAANVLLGTTVLANTFISSTQINANIPAVSSGTYQFTIFNSDGAGVLYSPGLVISGPPTWTTTSYISTTLALGIQLLASGDAPLTYYIQPGSSNPQNLTVNSTGYLTGTVSSEGAYYLTVIVDDAQSQSTQATITLTVSLTDPYFNLTTLALPADGTNNANNQSFIDSSSNNFTITRNGNATQGTFSPFSQTGWSNYFDGTSDSILTPGNTSLVLDGNFTIEFFMYLNSLSISAPISSNQGSFTAGAFAAIISHGTASNKLSIWAENINNAAFLIASNSTLSIARWYHVAIVRNSGVIRLYLNGVDEGNTSSSATITLNGGNTPRFRIGQYWNGTINGYISNLRVVKGSAVYTSAFTPPTSPLTAIANTSLLTCQSNRFVDNSTNAFVMTPSGDTSVQAFSPFAPAAIYSAATVGGSMYSDGTGDYLTIPDNAAFEMPGDFTVEAWFYCTQLPGAGQFGDIVTKGASGIFQPYYIFIRDSGLLVFYSSSTGSSWDIASNVSFGTIVLNTWYHLAVSRSGSDIRIFLNGSLVQTINNAASGNALTDNTRAVAVGARSDGTEDKFFGYISSVRIVKGVAVYTGAFTPPTAPLQISGNAAIYPSSTNVNVTFSSSSTSSLLNFTNAGITDATGKNVLETVGDAKISTAQSKFGGRSMVFDGTGDYLLTYSLTNTNAFGTGDFTIEMWFYVTTTASAQILIDFRPTGTDGLYPMIYVASGGGSVRYNVSNADQITGTTTISTSTWYHFALSRSGTSTRMFINGTQVGSTYTDSNNYLVGANRPVIGAGGNTVGASALNGYIDDLRITKGYARFTANFTPATDSIKLQ